MSYFQGMEFNNWGDFYDEAEAKEMYLLAKDLWPICRSLSGKGVRETLRLIKKRVPELIIHQISSGTKVFDWEIPQEWNIVDAYLLDPGGKKVVDFKKNNLHVVGYSEPVDIVLSLEELRSHLFSLPDQPDAVPYITSYYKRFWGFCLSHRQLESLKPGNYRAVIKSSLKNGHILLADALFAGQQKKEVFFSTYTCHPSMANNEISGPVVTTALAAWVRRLSNRRLSYRFYYGPETIGAIAYISQHLSQLKKNMMAGLVVTCVGDDRGYSFLPTRQGNCFVDKVSRFVLKNVAGKFKTYSFLDRGSDERQYGSPRVNLPVASIMRSKYCEYPEYHSSLDNLDLISPEGLGGSLAVLKAFLYVCEHNKTFLATHPCEPQFGKRGLYPTLSTKNSYANRRAQMDFLAYCDGTLDLVDIAETIGVNFLELTKISRMMEDLGLVREGVSSPRVKIDK